MKLKSIALALSFIAVSSVTANEEVTVTETTVKVSENEVAVTTTNDAVVSVSTPEQETTPKKVEVAPEVISEVAPVNSEEITN